MVRNNNSSREDIEEINAQKKQKKADESMTTRAIRGFIEKKLAKGGSEFNKMMESRCVGLEAEFATYISENALFDEQSKEQQESFKAVSSAQFLRETISIGAAFTSKRKALEHVISRRYDFSGSEMKKIRTEYEKLSRDELTYVLQSEGKREKFLKNIFPKKTLPYRSEKEQIDAVFGHNNTTTAQQEKIMNLLTKTRIDPIEVREALPLFDEEQKQLLLKMFLPTVTLGQLGDMGVLTKHQVQTALYKSIEKGELVPNFAMMTQDDRDNAVSQIDPYDVVIETMLFPKEIVDAILEGDGSKMIAQELSQQNTTRYEAFESENDLKMKPTKEGLFLPAFLQKLDKLGIKNTPDLKTGAIIRGVTQGENGKNINFAYRIDDISDDPEINKNTQGGGRVFALSDVLLVDGSLHLSAQKSKSAEYTYSEMYHIFDASKANVEILSPDTTKHRIDAGAMKETLLEGDIHNLSDLNRAIDSIDEHGKGYALRANGGASIQTGNPGDADFAIFQIQSINEQKGTVELVDRGDTEILDYVSFYAAFQAKKAKRLPPMKTGEEFLSAMKSHANKKEAFGKLAMDGGKFIAEDRKGEEGYSGVTEFAGSKGYIKILDTTPNGMVDFLVIKEYDESKPLNEQKKSERYMGGYHLLFNFMSREAFVPVLKDKEIQAPEKIDSHAHYHKDPIKHYMGNPTLHDIFKGASDLVGFMKHHLEHGSHIQSANMQLALAKKLKWMGVNDGMLREIRAKVYSGNKKLMTEKVDEFKGMPTKDRHKEVEHILLNLGSHDYEIQAATFAMLQKHGTLYAGIMNQYQGSFLYFERISGLKYSKDLKIVQSYTAACKRTGEPFREEGLIMEYLRWAGGEAGGYQIDGNLWLEVKKGWKSGMDDESAGGKREADQLYTPKGRSAYAMGKWKDGEYSNGIGAIDSMWGLGGKAHEMQLPGIVLALSNIPGSLHQDQLKTLKSKFFGGHPYTSLLFLGNQEEQNTFRSVIKRICENDPEMSKAYQQVEALQKKDPKKKLVEEIMEFWKKYGSVINSKLNVTQDGTLIHLAKTDKNCENYLKTCSTNYGGMSKPDADEVGNGAFDHGGSSLLGLNSDQYLKFLRVNAGQSVLEFNDDLTVSLFSGFKDSIGALKGMSIGSPEDTRDVQKTLYLQYHKAFMAFLMSHFRDKAYKDVGDQLFFKEMESKYGMSLVPYGTSLESAEYVKMAEDDFDVFITRGGRSVVAEKVHVVETFEKLLEETGYGKPAANDQQIRQRG